MVSLDNVEEGCNITILLVCLLSNTICITHRKYTLIRLASGSKNEWQKVPIKFKTMYRSDTATRLQDTFKTTCSDIKYAITTWLTIL